MPKATTRDHADAETQRFASEIQAPSAYAQCSILLAASLAAALTGCAAGEAIPPLRIAAPTVQAPRRVPQATIESMSPHAEGAGFFSVQTSPEQAASPDLDATLEEERIAALLRATARCPAEMALVDGRVCVDRWEGSLAERVPGGLDRQWSPFLSIDGREGLVRAVSRPGVVPQGYISGKQAQAACNASGKRLCTADEWERACRGPARTQFPYGQERRAGVCNDDIRPLHPVVEAANLLGLAPGSLWREAMNEALINQLPGTLLQAGERAACTNDYGVFDMVGNLHEWVDDPAGTFRGGYYMDTTRNGDGCAYATTAHDFDYHDYSTGFRCCMDPERVE